MKPMKLFVVSVNYSMPIGAESKKEAEYLVRELLTSNEYSITETGFSQAKYSAVQAESIKDIPRGWSYLQSHLFNSDDLDGVGANSILDGSFEKNRKELIKKKLMREVMNDLRLFEINGFTKDDLINCIKQLP